MEESFPSRSVTDHVSKSSVQLPAIQIIEIVLYFTISLIGITANSMVFYSLLGRHYLKVGEYLILNLALTDLATCVVSIPFDLTERLIGGFPFGTIMCSIVYPLQTVLMAVSVITLLSMSLEHRHIVMKPLLPRIHPKKAKIAICVSWIAPILLIIPHALVLRLNGDQCLERWPEHWHVQVFTLTNFTIFFAIPIVVIATSYFMAGRKVRGELSKLKDMLEGSNRLKRDYIRKRTIQKLKVTKMFIIVVVAFFVCMLPTHLVWIWHDFAQGSQRNAYFEGVLAFSNIFMYLNSALNPFIFRSVRGKSFSRLIACCCRMFDVNASESRLSPRCVYTHRQMSQVERGRAIRFTKQTPSKSSYRFEMCYETSV
ncbi:G-protein coupled receptor 54-like [Stylophora pistillata]|uniref:G-protein coupled receptor 54-like n=1 Tax=Stylophora pistillata TaxID=50429 RepID=UPI000C04E575|nr:G-protein coupled receptor 54-like [Stylophora pistillata]